MNHAATIDALKRSARLLQATDDEGVRMVGNGLANWHASKEALPFENFIGLANGQGERTWRTTHAFDQRNAFVREATAKHWPGAPELHLALHRYHCSGWQRERQLRKCPAHRIGKPEELLWRILHERDIVLSARQINDIVRR